MMASAAQESRHKEPLVSNITDQWSLEQLFGQGDPTGRDGDGREGPPRELRKLGTASSMGCMDTFGGCNRHYCHESWQPARLALSSSEARGPEGLHRPIEVDHSDAMIFTIRYSPDRQAEHLPTIG